MATTQVRVGSGVSHRLIRSVVLSSAVIVGFHALVLLSFGQLLYEAVLAWRGDTDVSLLGSILRVVLALVLLASVIAPLSASDVPDRRLLPEEHPDLFSMIARAAAEAGVRAPSAVFLTRGSPSLQPVGRSGSSELGLGLPYLLALTVDQLEAVVAHEFGHLRPRPWLIAFLVHRRNVAVARAERLRQQRLLVRLVGVLFSVYSFVLRRVAIPLAHAEEFGADAVAARVAGCRALVECLTVTDAVFECFQVYWAKWVFPALVAGFRPPFFDGFADFLDAPIGQHIREAAAARRAQSDTDVSTDSHPSKHARLEAIAMLSPISERASADSRPALALLGEQRHFEDEALLLGARGPVELNRLVPLSWDDFGEQVLTRHWGATAECCGRYLPAVTPEDLPPAPSFYADFALSAIQGAFLGNTETLVQRGVEDIATAIMFTLWRHGWHVQSRPGELPWLYKDGLHWSPLLSLTNLVQQRTSRQSWLRECSQAGVAGVELGCA